MKILIGITLVFALMAGVACADYFSITPSDQDSVISDWRATYDVWWHMDEASIWIDSYDFMFGYDSSELELIEPRSIPNTFPSPGFALFNPEVIDDKAGNVELRSHSDENIVPDIDGKIHFAQFYFRVIIADYDGNPDFWKVADVGAFGIARWDPDFNGIYTAQYNAALGADVIPEPTTTVLLGIGLAGMLLRKKS